MGRRLRGFFKGCLRLVTSWKLTLALAAVVGLFILWAELFLKGKPIPLVPESEEKIIQLGANALKVGGELWVADEEYMAGTDSLFAIMLKGKDNLLVASLAKGCPDSNRYGFEPFILDSLAALAVDYPEKYYLFDITLNGDTAYCYHFMNQLYGNIESVSIYIPSRCLYMEVYGNKVSEETALPYLEKMVYYGAGKLEWTVSRMPEHRKKNG